MDINDDSMYKMYLDEIKDQIESLDEKMVLLENQSDDTELINEIFRIVHTMKGSSTTFKVHGMTDILHNFESLLGKIKNNELKINAEIMDIVFEAVDSLKYIYSCITSNDQLCIEEVDDIVKKIQSILEVNDKKYKDPVGNGYEDITIDDLQEIEVQICNSEDLKLRIYKIIISLKQSVTNKKTLINLLVDSLNEIGKVIRMIPEEYNETLEKKLGSDFEFMISTDKNKGFVDNELKYMQDDLNSISIKEIIRNKKKAEPVAKDKKKNKVQEEKAVIKVDLNKIDKLINLVGELVIDKEALNQLAIDVKSEFKGNPTFKKMLNIFSHLNYISYELQEKVMSVRMLPIENIFNRFPRMVRDIANKCDKEINFIIEGKDTEIDRSIMEQLSDPIMHIIRNAVDHGIESKDERIKNGKSEKGNVILKARYCESNVIIEITDDGSGIDIDKIKEKAINSGLIIEEDIKVMTDNDILQLIFVPGFSTSEKVTEISGRGVGMDVVKSNIRKLNGSVDIDTTKGKGTTFTIRLPLTIEIIQALMFRENDYKFALPISSVIEIIRLKSKEIDEKIHLINNIEVFEWREQYIPIIAINSYFKIQPLEHDINIESKKMMIIIVGYGDKKLALKVTQLLGSQEIVIKPMGDFIGKDKLFGDVGGVCGESILGDGSFAHILDVGIISDEWRNIMRINRRKYNEDKY